MPKGEREDMAMSVPGTLRVSNEVIADLAGYAAMECYGVVGMAYTDDQQHIVDLLSLRTLRKGIEVKVEDGKVVVVLHVVVNAQVNMRQVTENLKSTVSFVLKTIAEIKDAEVRVFIEDIRAR